MSTLNVNTINAATSGQAVAVDISNPRSFRNLIINGSMICSQRGTSGSGAYGYYSVDRWYNFNNGLNENPTIAQADVASSTSPYNLGFRKSLKVTNGNQTGGAGTSDQTFISTTLEAQEIANCGWNYTSTSSYITLSFWVKASVAQTYYGYLKAPDGSNYIYPYSFALSANTWTKITKSIPGNANLQFDNNANAGLEVGIYLFLGTDLTASSASSDTWAAYSGGTTRTLDHTSTWYTTNDATFEMTGVQLEVGSYATDFEHRSYGEELARCQRYYQNSYAEGNVPGSSNSSDNAINLLSWADGNVQGFTFMGRMRASPDVILRSANATTVARLDSSGTDRVATAQHINQHHVKYIAVTSGAGNSWASVCYELNAEL